MNNDTKNVVDDTEFFRTEKSEDDRGTSEGPHWAATGQQDGS